MSDHVSTADLKIVVVDDNPDVLDMMVSIAREFARDVIDFENAEAALEYLKSTAVDLLVADIRLPGMSGPVFAAEARSVQPGLGIIFATGGAYPGEAEADTTTVLLRKPYDSKAFEHALRSVLGRR